MPSSAHSVPPVMVVKIYRSMLSNLFGRISSQFIVSSSMHLYAQQSIEMYLKRHIQTESQNTIYIYIYIFIYIYIIHLHTYTHMHIPSPESFLPFSVQILNPNDASFLIYNGVSWAPCITMGYLRFGFLHHYLPSNHGNP